MRMGFWTMLPRFAMTAVLVAVMAESLICASFHQVEYRHKRSHCHSEAVAHDHQAELGDALEVPCPCPERHDCDHCKSHSHNPLSPPGEVKEHFLPASAWGGECHGSVDFDDTIWWESGPATGLGLVRIARSQRTTVLLI